MQGRKRSISYEERKGGGGKCSGPSEKGEDACKMYGDKMPGPICKGSSLREPLCWRSKKGHMRIQQYGKGKLTAQKVEDAIRYEHEDGNHVAKKGGYGKKNGRTPATGKGCKPLETPRYAFIRILDAEKGIAKKKTSRVVRRGDWPRHD